MESSFRGVLKRTLSNTPLAVTLLFVAAYAVLFTLAFGPSLEVAFGMLGVGMAATAVEVRRRD